MEDPDSLAEVLAFTGPRGQKLRSALAEAHATNERRRAEVLKHDDLRRELQLLGYHNPEQWNGYIPPATINEFSPEELCSSSVSGRLNQRDQRGTGETINDSPRRAILVAISAAAWERRQATEEDM